MPKTYLNEAGLTHLWAIIKGAFAPISHTHSVATTTTDGFLSSTDKAIIDSMSSGSVTGVKGNSEETYRTGNVNVTAANVGAVDKTGDTMSGNLTVDTNNTSTMVTAKSSTSQTSLYAGSSYIGLYDNDTSSMYVYKDKSDSGALKPLATTTANGFMSSTDKTKLNGLSAVSGMAADGAAPSIANGTTYTNLLTTGVTLTANHRYLCTYTVQWTSNANGRRGVQATIDGTGAGVISQSVCAPANGAATIHGATFWIQASTSARTLNFQGYQNAGTGTSLTATLRYQLIDFGT